MNKHNAKDYLPLVQALADGKTIQGKSSITDSGFEDYYDGVDIDFTAPVEYYRIKPEPVDRWYLKNQEVYLTKKEYESGKWNVDKAIKLVEETE